MEILKDDHPTLKQSAKQVVHFNESLKLLSMRMISTMKQAGGVGLAANQVGILKSIAVFRKSSVGVDVMINPVILEKSEETECRIEGCLSYDDLYKVERSFSIDIIWMTIKGEMKRKKFSGFPARVIMHEVDHLSGITFNDIGEKVEEE